MNDENNTGGWRSVTISIVGSAVDTKTYPTTLGEVLEGIRTGKWEKIVKRVSAGYAKAFETAKEEGKPDPSIAAKKTANKLKRELPAVTFSGAFKERADSAIESHSGFICIDADNCAEPAGIRAKLANDPCVQAAFVSPTGTGCKALVRIPADASAHARSFAAARKHFKEAHGIAIDEACKNLSRLCYVAHDADAFIRSEDAKLLEPLPAEKPSTPQRPESGQRDLEGLMVLPKEKFTTYSASAEAIYKRISERRPPEIFIRSGCVATIEETVADDGAAALSIMDTDAYAFRSKVERYGTLFAWQAGPHGVPLIRKDALMSVDTAKVLLASDQRLQLPPLSMVHRCPILIERDGKPVVLGHGYHPDLGGRYVTSNVEIRTMPLAEAAEHIMALIEEFSFATLADKSRAVAAIITPALRFGGLLRCHFPAVLVEADRPQAGKGTLVEAIQRFYGEPCELTGKRKGGVGSFDEDLSRQMLRGRPFIPVDNVRQALDSEFFEHALTCPFGTTISARVPYKPGISVDPNRHIFHLTSNKFESTQDLAARSCVIRLQKRDGYQWKKFGDGRELLAHLEADFATLISIVYSIASQWVARGKPAKRRRTARRRTLSRMVAGFRLDRTEGIRSARALGRTRENSTARRQCWAIMGPRHGEPLESPWAALPQSFPRRGWSSWPVKRTKMRTWRFRACLRTPTTKTRRSASDPLWRNSSGPSHTRSRSMLYRVTRVERQEDRPAHYDSYVRKSYVFELTGEYPPYGFPIGVYKVP